MKKAAIFFATSFIILAFAVTGALIYLFGGGDSREIFKVPDYVGMNITQAVSDKHFEIKCEGIYSDAPEGEIISQDPYAGAERKLARGERCALKLTVSLGEKTERIPNLARYHYTEASNILRELGAKIRLVSVYDDTLERDLVLHTSPEAGNAIEKGDIVTLFVSRNHTMDSVKVGSFCGMAREDAVAEILSSGLYIDVIELEYSSEFEEGVVISLSIRHGSLVPYGSGISLTVSAGEKKEELHPFGRAAEKENIKH